MNNHGTVTVSAQGDREIVIARVFDAPRDLVFEAHTKPELLKRWFGVRSGWTLPICEIDLRVGGAYRYVWRKESKGKDMGASGVFREIEAPERLVYTEMFDDFWYAGESLNTMLLVEQGGQTLLTITSRYELQETRDTVLKSGMERGLEESYQVLDDLLARPRAEGTAS
jgi:uncharacterized protein YndB with AHSA1/START domain